MYRTKTFFEFKGFSRPWVTMAFQPCRIGSVGPSLTGNQLYVGIPRCAFDNLRPTGLPKAPEMIASAGVIVKFGRTNNYARRAREHAAAFGGFHLLDHFGGVTCLQTSEESLKKRLDAVGLRLQGRHTGTAVCYEELVLVSNQDEYRTLYELVAWAAGLGRRDDSIERERELTKRCEVEWNARRVIEQEKTEQLRLMLALQPKDQPTARANRRYLRRSTPDGREVVTYAGLSHAAQATGMKANAICSKISKCKQQRVPVTFRLTGEDVWAYL